MTSFKRNITALILLTAIFAGSVSFLLLNHGDTYSTVSFTLQDTSGNTFTEKNLRGKWSIITFGFTSCPDICPTHVAEVSRALLLLQESGIQQMITPVFISVDYVRDNAAILDKYLKFFHKKYVGLTGNQHQLDLTVDTFNSTYSVTQTSYNGQQNINVTHSSLLYLIDPYGRIIKQLPFGYSAQEIAKQIKTVL